MIIMHLKSFFNMSSRVDRHETSKKLLHYKIIEGSHMNTYVLFMIEYYLSTS